MPELPEVETITKAICKALKNATIYNVAVRNIKLRELIPTDLVDKLKNKKILGYRRIAKYIVIDCSENISLILHLGMSGKIKLSEKLEALEKHDHIVFETTEGYMVYNDPRRFGLCLLAETNKLMEHRIFKNIGIDPFDKNLNGKYLFDKLSKKSVPIKIALLDQAIVCGIGNIYASEALYLSEILPTRPAHTLSLAECSCLVDNIRKTLEKAIKAGGSTLRDYRKPDGSLGYFQNSHCVYNKMGHPCPNCTCNLEKTGGIQKIVQAGRSTYFCATKQR